jgi:serine/threonine protein kinase
MENLEDQNLKSRIEVAIKNKALKIIGKVLNNRFQIVDFVGSGATSNTYLAKNIEKGTSRFPDNVVVKIYKDWVLEEKTQVERIIRETDNMSAIDHPNLMKVYGCDTHHDVDTTLIYLIIEYLRGMTLTEFLEKSGQIKEDMVIDFMLQICYAVKALHEKELIHRDLKPDNIMVVQEDGKYTLKVMDFGVIRKLAETSITESGEFLGTLRYASPEWILGDETSLTTDLYSVGAILYKLLTGKEPFHRIIRNRAALTAEILKESQMQETSKLFENFESDFRDLISVSPYFKLLGRRLTLKDPKNRIQQIDAVITILKEGACSEWWIKYCIENSADWAKWYSDPWYGDWITVGELLEQRASRQSDRKEAEELLAKSVGAYEYAISEGKWLLTEDKPESIFKELEWATKKCEALKDKLRASVKESNHRLPICKWYSDGSCKISYVTEM